MLNVLDAHDLDCRAEIAEVHAQAMLRILLDCFNRGADDQEWCKLLGHYVASEVIAMVARGEKETYAVFHALDHIIREYGEDVDETYTGRDSEGEKTYHTYNPETNWHTRCHPFIWPALNKAGIV